MGKGGEGIEASIRCSQNNGLHSCEAHPVCFGSQSDQPRSEEAMGEDSKGIEASSGENCFGSCKAHYVGLRPPKDRSGTAGAVGESEGAKEGGLEPADPITRIVLHSYSSEEYQQLCCLW